MKDFVSVVALIIAIAIAIASVVLCILFVRWVVTADIPLWLKIFILRG